MEEGRRFRFKIVVIGDGRVGKTSIIKKFTKAPFRQDYVKTIGAQFSVYNKEMGDDKVSLIIWDIAGQDMFHFLRPSFFKNSKAAIIVYSLEDSKLGFESFNHISNWDDDIKKYCGDIPVYIFANKSDLIDKNIVDEDEIRRIVEEFNLRGYFITSAKTGQGINEGFNAISTEQYDGFYPYPFIFKPPSPPDDFAMASQVKIHTPLKENDIEDVIFCQHCGMKLTKEEQFTHFCKKKPK
ncbi:MAG: Rab family GTPase [Candidatus Hermodarchaeota archaeon]